MTESLLEKSIKFFQFDGAFESVKSKFHDFLFDCGITYIEFHVLIFITNMVWRKENTDTYITEIGFSGFFAKAVFVWIFPHSYLSYK